jgi:hypothetical protein
MWKPSISPPPTATEAWMKERRERICFVMSPQGCSTLYSESVK